MRWVEKFFILLSNIYDEETKNYFNDRENGETSETFTDWLNRTQQKREETFDILFEFFKENPDTPIELLAELML